MTGVRSGSQGTGINAGSQGSGAGSGGSLPTPPLYIGSSVRESNMPYTSSHTLPTCDVGDLILLNVITLNTTSVPPTTPPGWSVLQTSVQAGIYPIYSRTYYRIKQAGDAASVTLTNGAVSNTYASIVAHAFTGVRSPNPIASNVAFNQDNTDPLSVTADAVTTTLDGCLAVNILAGINTGSTVSAPSAGTEVDRQIPIPGSPGTLTTHDAPTIGSYGAATWTATNQIGAANFTVTTVALAGTGGPTVTTTPSIVGFTNGPNGTQFTSLSLPSHVAGDRALLYLSTHSVSLKANVPVGWTPLAENFYVAGNKSTTVCTKILDGVESSVSWVDLAQVGTVLVVRNSGLPIINDVKLNTQALGTTWDAPPGSATIVDADVPGLDIILVSKYPGLTTFSTPTGTTIIPGIAYTTTIVSDFGFAGWAREATTQYGGLNGNAMSGSSGYAQCVTISCPAA